MSGTSAGAKKAWATRGRGGGGKKGGGRGKRGVGAAKRSMFRQLFSKSARRRDAAISRASRRYGK